jgi:hypothetical protein
MGVAARIAGGLVVGLTVGAAAGALTGPRDDGSPVAATTTSTVILAAAPDAPLPEAEWIDGGVRFRSSVLVPLSFTVEEARAELEFEVVPLHWTVDDAPAPEEIPVQPEHWMLTTDGGAVFTSTSVLGDDVVRWDVSDDLTTGDVAEVAITGWRLATPVGEAVTLPLEVGAMAGFEDGAEIVIDTVLDQVSSTIVQLDSRLPEDPWHHGSSLAVITVPDPGWRVGFRFNQSSNVQLIWAGTDAPDEIEVVQGYPLWLPVAANTVVLGERS